MIISGQRPSMDQEAHDRQMRPALLGRTMGNMSSGRVKIEYSSASEFTAETSWNAHWQHGFLFFCGSKKEAATRLTSLEKSLLLPTKYLRRERCAHDKHYGQCPYVAHVRPPIVALPNPFQKRHGVG